MTGPKMRNALVPRNSRLVAVLLIAASCIFATTTGYDGALMNGLNIMPAYQKYFNLTAKTKPLLTAASYIGSAPASLIFGFVTNKIGRKKAIVLSACLKLTGVTLMAASQNFGMFLTGRILLGFGSGASNTAAPTWLAETLPYKKRGSGLSMIFVVWYVGSLLAAGVTYGTSGLPGNLCWRVPAALQCVFSVACLAILAFTPESPRWLVYQGRTDEALEVVAICNSNGDINDPATVLQYQEIIDTLTWEKESGETLSYVQVMKTPTARKRVMLATSVAIITNLSGNNIVSYYLGQMLSNAGIKSTHTQLEINICLSAFCLVCAGTGSQLVDRLGRKPLALISVGLLTVFMFLVGGLTKLFGHATDNTSGVYATVAMIFLFQGSYSFGLTPLTVLYPPEVLNYSIRATGMACFVMAVNLVGVLVTYAFPIALSVISYKIYLINAVWDVFQFAFIYIFWVETKGKTLEEIDAILDGEMHSDVPAIGDLDKSKLDVEAVETVTTVTSRIPYKS